MKIIFKGVFDSKAEPSKKGIDPTAVGLFVWVVLWGISWLAIVYCFYIIEYY